MSKRMRLPNGFGQISYLKGRRLRKPYRAMVTVGKTAEGRPICKLLKPEAYFATYNDAYTALLQYRQNPYDFHTSATFKEIYDKWFASWSVNKSESTLRRNTYCLQYCEEVLHTDIREIKPMHILSCMDKTPSPGFKKATRFIFKEVLNYGVEHGILTVNVAKTFDTKISDEGKKRTIQHRVLTPEEINMLWERKQDPVCRAILIQCYTGFRPDELCVLKKSDVNMKNWTITGGMKTEAGRNRVVPVIEKIKGIVGDAMNTPTDSFITTQYGKSMEYRNYYKRMKELLPDHLPHDCRKTFVTMAKKAGVNDFAIKRIVGHSIKDITEDVYTERDVEWLRQEAERISMTVYK